MIAQGVGSFVAKYIDESAVRQNMFGWVCHRPRHTFSGVRWLCCCTYKKDFAFVHFNLYNVSWASEVAEQ